MRRILGLSLIPRKEQCSKDEYIGEGAPVSETKNEQPEKMMIVIVIMIIITIDYVLANMHKTL